MGGSSRRARTLVEGVYILVYEVYMNCTSSKNKSKAKTQKEQQHRHLVPCETLKCAGLYWYLRNVKFLQI